MAKVSNTPKTPEFKSEEDIFNQVLKIRGIADKDEFLNPPNINKFLTEKSLKELFGNTYKNFSELKKVLTEAILQNRFIVLYGDYDVDGTSSLALLWSLIYDFLVYKNCTPFIPDRFLHGYGLSKKGLDFIVERNKEKIKSGVKPLLITADCGITNVEEVAYANLLGFEVVIIDHHELPKELPQASLILHSTALCACGICFLISSYIKGMVDNENLDLAALATICDLQILLGVNRSIAKYGLEKLTNSKRPGIVALKEVSGISGKQISPYEVGYILGPRLNAAGRIETAMDSLRLLVSKNSDFAMQIAEKLNELNRERQGHTEAIFNEASELYSSSEENIIVAHGKNYHEGVIGIVAQKLVQKYFKPAIVLSEGELVSKASVRSFGNINIIEFLRTFESYFINVGGHKLAAGFSIENIKLEEFKKELFKKARERIDKKNLKQRINSDLSIEVDFANLKLAKLLSQLEPFGLGNREPLFETNNLYIYDIKVFGQNQKHLTLTLGSNEGYTINAKLFNGMTETYEKLSLGQKISIVYTLGVNFYRDKEYLDVIIKDLAL